MQVACIKPSKMDSLRTLYDMRTLYIVRRSTSSATAMGAVRVGTCGGILSHTVAARAVRRFSRIESPRSRREYYLGVPTESAQLLGVPCASQGKGTHTYACKLVRPQIK